MAVTAIKYGGVRLHQPFDAGQIVDHVRDIAAQARRANGENHGAGVAADFPGREPSSARDRGARPDHRAGASNKEAGRHLGISPRTIEVHRARIMELGARNAADPHRADHRRARLTAVGPSTHVNSLGYAARKTTDGEETLRHSTRSRPG